MNREQFEEARRKIDEMREAAKLAGRNRRGEGGAHRGGGDNNTPIAIPNFQKISLISQKPLLPKFFYKIFRILSKLLCQGMFKIKSWGSFCLQVFIISPKVYIHTIFSFSPVDTIKSYIRSLITKCLHLPIIVL